MSNRENGSTSEEVFIIFFNILKSYQHCIALIVQETHEHLEDGADPSSEEVFAVYVEGARQRTNLQVLRRRRRDEVVDIISRQRAEILRQTSGVSFLASFSEVFVISLFVHCPDQEIGDFAEMLTDLRRLNWLQADVFEVFTYLI